MSAISVFQGSRKSSDRKDAPDADRRWPDSSLGKGYAAPATPPERFYRQRGANMKIFARPRDAQGRWSLLSLPAGSRFSADSGHSLPISRDWPATSAANGWSTVGRRGYCRMPIATTAQPPPLVGNVARPGLGFDYRQRAQHGDRMALLDQLRLLCRRPRDPVPEGQRRRGAAPPAREIMEN
jgi:hypothetical protein